MEIYNNFMSNHYDEMSNACFRYIKKEDKLNISSSIPAWTNIFKFDLGDKAGKDKNISKSSKPTYERIIEFHSDILQKEIEIIQPKIIIFFTGHHYDKLYFDPIVKKDGDYKKLFLKIEELEDINE